MKSKKRKSISAFSVLFIILIILALITVVLNGSKFTPVTLADGTIVDTVSGARLQDIINSPFNGFVGAIEICIFILFLGGMLGIVAKTGALEASIQNLVFNLKGKELVIIPVLMFLFSVGGTTFGMAEESIAFYSIITATMVAAGFDTLVAAATILLGAGAGVLGSTINPFSTSIAVETLGASGIESNFALVMGIGAVLWVTTTAYSIFVVLKYAKKIQKDKGSTLLSLQEVKDMEEHYGKKETDGRLEYTNTHRNVLVGFAFTFIVMIISLIPWDNKFGITIFKGWSSVLTGNDLGNWGFSDLAVWFALMAVIIGIIAKLSEKDIVDTFIEGAKDMFSVVLIIAVARGVSVIMSTTHLDLFVLDRIANALHGLSAMLFAPVSYIIYVVLSFFVPSTSGLATLSMPIMGGITKELGLNPSIMVSIFAAAAGLVNLVTPTSGVVMGGLEISKVDYSTWIKFIVKPLIIIAIMNIAILTVAMMVF